MSAELIQKAWTLAQFDNVEELSKLVPSQVNPNASTKSEKNHIHTLLMIAAASGAEEATKFLLEQGAKANGKNPMGYTALHWCAYVGRTECVQQLIDAGASFDSKTQDGRTPIHVAAQRGHLDFIKFIVEIGADINSISSNGWTALHYAVIGNQAAVGKYLFEEINGTYDWDSVDTDGKTIDDIAAEYKHSWYNKLRNIDDKLSDSPEEDDEKPDKKETPKKKSPK